MFSLSGYWTVTDYKNNGLKSGVAQIQSVAVLLSGDTAAKITHT